MYTALWLSFRDTINVEIGTARLAAILLSALSLASQAERRGSGKALQLCSLGCCALRSTWLPMSPRWDELLTLGTAQSLKLFPIGGRSLDGTEDFSGWCYCSQAALPVSESLKKSLHRSAQNSWDHGLFWIGHPGCPGVLGWKPWSDNCSPLFPFNKPRQLSPVC